MAKVSPTAVAFSHHPRAWPGSLSASRAPRLCMASAWPGQVGMTISDTFSGEYGPSLTVGALFAGPPREKLDRCFDGEPPGLGDVSGCWPSPMDM